MQLFALALWVVLSLWQPKHVLRVGEERAWVSWHEAQEACPALPWAPMRPMALWQAWHVGLLNLWGLWHDWQLPCVAPRDLAAADCPPWHLEQRAHQSPGAWCGLWHELHWCLPPLAEADSLPWQLAQGVFCDQLCCWWHPGQALCCAAG